MGTGSRALPGLGARWGVGLLALLIAAVMVSLAAGAYPVPLRDIPEVLLHAVFPGVFQAAPDPTAETVVIGLRLPRTVLAAIAGAGLAVSGAAFQTLFRNPLATPDTLGVATGASCGAALAILLGWSGLGIQTLSFLFGIAAVALVTSVSRVPGSNRILMLILSGIERAFLSARSADQIRGGSGVCSSLDHVLADGESRVCHMVRNPHGAPLCDARDRASLSLPLETRGALASRG
jgi:iron complex transport system permease protein